MSTVTSTPAAAKRCDDCGEPSLASATQCWSCGSSRLILATLPDADDVTQGYDSADFVTQGWSLPQRRNYLPLWIGLGCTLLASMLASAYWMGRAAAVGPVPVVRAEPPAAPQSLPSPPTTLVMPDWSAPTPATAPVDPPPSVRVTPIRDPRPAPTTPVRTQPSMQLTVPPVVPASPVRRVTVIPTPPDPGPGSAGPVPGTAPRGMALVLLRNDSGAPAYFRFGGAQRQEVSVGAGITLPVPLTPGGYTVSASAAGESTPEASLTFAADTRSTLAVTRRNEGERSSLILLEPL